MFTFLRPVPHPCYSSIASVYPARKRSIRRWHEVNGSNETLMLVFRGLAWRRRTPHRAEVAGAVEVAEVKRRPRRLQAPPPPPRNCRRTRPIRCSIRLRSSVVSQFFFPHFFLFPVSSFSFCFFFSSTIYIFLYFCISCARSSYRDLVVAYIDMYTSVDKSPNIYLLWPKKHRKLMKFCTKICAISKNPESRACLCRRSRFAHNKDISNDMDYT